MTKISQKGFLIVLVMIIIALLILLAFYFLDFIITDTKITQSHHLATKAYYLAEAGTREAIWKITNDPTWYNNFSTDPNWQVTLSRAGIFDENDSYNILVKNSGIAEAEIFATSTVNMFGQTSQRAIKIKVYKALTSNFQQGLSVFTNDEIYLTGTILNINDSSIYSHNDIYVYLFSTLNVDGDVMALDSINKSWTSNINADNLYSNNYPPPPDEIEMPQIDFDSVDPNSYKNSADNIYSQQEFDNLCDEKTCVLNGITYVTGNINLHRGTDITINGVLVLDDNFKIGVAGGKWWLPAPRMTINYTPGLPAGILCKKSITFGASLNNSLINGLIYAGNTFNITNLFFGFTINGGVIAHRLDIGSLWQPLTINLDQEIINNTLISPTESPVIIIEHWEEEY